MSNSERNHTSAIEATSSDRSPKPADAVACAALGCRRNDDLERVKRHDGTVRTLCPEHRKYFLGVSS